MLDPIINRILLLSPAVTEPAAADTKSDAAEEGGAGSALPAHASFDQDDPDDDDASYVPPTVPDDANSDPDIGKSQAADRPRDEQGRFLPKDAAAGTDRAGDSPDVDAEAEAQEHADREAYDRVKAAERGETSKEDEPDPEASDTQGAETQGAKPDAAAGSDIDPERMVLARQALRRDGWKEDELKSLPADRLVRIGEHRMKVQRDIDERLGTAPADPALQIRQHGTDGQQKAGDGLAKPAAQTPGTDAAQRDSIQTPPDEALREALDYLDEDQQKVVKAAIEGGKSAQQQLAELQQQHGQKLEQLVSELVETRVRVVQRDLAREYPQITKVNETNPDDPYMAKLKRLADTGLYDATTDAGLKELMRDAAALAFGNQMKQQSQQELLNRNREQRRGQVNTETKVAPSKPISEDDLDRMAYDATKQAEAEGLTGAEAATRVRQIMESKRNAGKRQ
jgi:hypothetical protein